MIRLLNYCIILSLFSSLAEANDGRDKDYEDRLHSIYLKNYKNPVTPEEWSKLIDFLNKSYKLKYKDNFWDLSKTFFKDSLYWSKLWVANPLVENPHRIYKGDSIKFDIKTLKAVNTSKYSTPISQQFPNVELQPQLYKKRSLRGYEIPSSLPFIIENVNLEPVSSEIQFSLDLIKVKKEALLPFYLTDEKPQTEGEVMGKDGYGFMSANGENIIVKIEGEISIGSRYTVFKNKGALKKSFFLNLLKTNIYEIQIKGEIKILNYISGTDSIYRAQIIKSLAGITKGDSILHGSRPTFTLSQRGNYGTANGTLIGVPNQKIKMLSLYSIVYLDKGMSHGVRVNDHYHIRARSTHSIKKHTKRPYKYKQSSIGQMRVIHADPNLSTAIITQAKDQIYLNDFFSGSLGSVSDLEQSGEHESIESPKDSYNLKENLLHEEEVEEIENEELEEIDEDENEELEEIDEDENEELEEIDEDENEDLEEIDEDAGGNMKEIKDEFKDLENLEEIEE